MMGRGREGGRQEKAGQSPEKYWVLSLLNEDDPTDQCEALVKKPEDCLEVKESWEQPTEGSAKMAEGSTSESTQFQQDHPRMLALASFVYEPLQVLHLLEVCEVGNPAYLWITRLREARNVEDV